MLSLRAGCSPHEPEGASTAGRSIVSDCLLLTDVLNRCRRAPAPAPQAAHVAPAPAPQPAPAKIEPEPDLFVSEPAAPAPVVPSNSGEMHTAAAAVLSCINMINQRLLFVCCCESASRLPAKAQGNLFASNDDDSVNAHGIENVFIPQGAVEKA